MVATGMHKTLLPYALATYGELGYEMLYLPASLAHNIRGIRRLLRGCVKSQR